VILRGYLQINRVKSITHRRPRESGGSRATAQSDQRVAAAKRRAVYRLPPDSRVRGNDDRRSTYITSRARAYSRPSSSLASSLMRSWVQVGVQTSLTRASLTPGTAATAALTSPGMLAATGQEGVVNVISTKTMPPFFTRSS